jgi:hypothetical protein
MRGRSAIAMASTGKDQSRWLSLARRYARRIAREQMPWSNPIGRLLDAGIASVEGDHQKAEAALTEAIGGFDQADMQLYASVARRRIGDLRNDDYGRAMRQQADAWMAEQQIKNPDRFTRMFAPGSWRATM